MKKEHLLIVYKHLHDMKVVLPKREKIGESDQRKKNLEKILQGSKRRE